MTTEAPTARLYECMFLISQGEAADLSAVLDHIREILGRGDAEILAMRKWDERRLAYEIDKQKRGVYILCYVKAPGDGIARIERETNLSEHIMRLIVIRADHMSDDQARAADDLEGLATEAKLRAEKAAVESSERSTGARLGAPDPAEMPKKDEAPAPEAEEPKDENAAAEDKPAE
jgi:small subunit ribosomal protein S6